MDINSPNLTTADGYPFRILATDLGGTLPYAIFVNNEVARLDNDLRCPANEGYSLTTPRKVNTRYVNVYRAADGTFCFGKASYLSNEQRLALHDTHRALCGMCVTFDETMNTITANLVP